MFTSSGAPISDQDIPVKELINHNLSPKSSNIVKENPKCSQRPNQSVELHDFGLYPNKEQTSQQEMDYNY